VRLEGSDEQRGSGGSADALATFEMRLGRALFRFDCPAPLTIGEYDLDLLGPEERTAVAQHLLECHHCSDELAQLRSFMAAEPSWSPGLAEQVRRLVANLVTPRGRALQPGLARLRDIETVPAAIYRADDLSITLERGPDEREVSGLVTRDRVGPEELAGLEIHLLAADASRQVAQLGPAGDFAFPDVPAGTFDLELRLLDRVVLVTGVDLDAL
jgi:hypothetical protein